jgi:hypothetical protein
MTHFNGLTPAEAERLACFAEEMGETIQVIGKILRHGYESKHPNGGPTNRQLLEKEVGDVLGILDLLTVNEDIQWASIGLSQANKYPKMRKYLHHQ